MRARRSLVRSLADRLRSARRIRGRKRLGGRGGPDDRPVPTGGDGYQTEPPTPRE